MSFFVKIFVFAWMMIPGIFAFSQVEYPYPQKHILVKTDHGDARFAYMDIPPVITSEKVIVLLHGKNFNGYYWKDLIPVLANAGYRVIVPDQVGWGRSDKPITSYSFHWLANNTANLLDSLGIINTVVLGHSMGGMLACRFAILYPHRVTRLILENPIGLEDYKRFVPFQTTGQLVEKELAATYESYKKYQQGYYPEWKTEYEQYVKAQAEALNDPDFPIIARVNALTYQMIYEEPVSYEWDRIQAPTLLLIGQEDRTIVGKGLLNKEQQQIYGNYPVLGRKTKNAIRNAKLVELKGIGHIPHIQDLNLFQRHLLQFLPK
jgi:pimeloyl-ACP methyl ester carboxylesterase